MEITFTADERELLDKIQRTYDPRNHPTTAGLLEHLSDESRDVIVTTLEPRIRAAAEAGLMLRAIVERVEVIQGPSPMFIDGIHTLIQEAIIFEDGRCDLTRSDGTVVEVRTRFDELTTALFGREDSGVLDCMWSLPVDAAFAALGNELQERAQQFRDEERRRHHETMARLVAKREKRQVAESA